MLDFLCYGILAVWGIFLDVGGVVIRSNSNGYCYLGGQL